MTNSLAITAITSGAQRAPLVLRGDLLKSLKEASQLGYDALEIHVIEADTFPAELICNACREYGMKISAIVTGQIFTRRHLCITSPDPQNREQAMNELFDYIDIAAQVDASDGVVIGWVKGNRPESAQDEFDRLLAEQLTILGTYAAKKGQKILVEVINRYETNLFNTAAELRTFLETWNLPNCYIHLDTFHMNIEENNMAQAIATAGKYLGYFHVADSNRLYPGAGHLDFVTVFRALKEAGYQGSISLECIPEPDSISAGTLAKKTLLEAIRAV